MKLQIIDDKGKMIASYDRRLTNGGWEHWYLGGFVKCTKTSVVISSFVAGRSGYRMIKTRWYHAGFDLIRKIFGIYEGDLPDKDLFLKKGVVVGVYKNGERYATEL